MKISKKTKAFVAATAQRMVRVFASAFLAFLAASGTTDLHFDWERALSVSAYAALATLLMCLAGNYATDGAGPAFGKVEVTSPPAPPVN